MDVQCKCGYDCWMFAARCVRLSECRRRNNEQEIKSLYSDAAPVSASASASLKADEKLRLYRASGNLKGASALARARACSCYEMECRAFLILICARVYICSPFVLLLLLLCGNWSGNEKRKCASSAWRGLQRSRQRWIIANARRGI